jgi:4-alpha-glucanotransferase
LAKESLIDKLAVFHGIESQYVDNWGRIRPASSEIKKKLLKAMGVAVNSKQAEDAMQGLLESELSNHLTQPSIVARLNSPPKQLVFQVPFEKKETGRDELMVSLGIQNERGETKNTSYRKADLSFVGVVDQGGGLFRRWGLPFPALKDIGYYQLKLSVTNGDYQKSQRIHVAMCPSHAFMPTEFQGDGRTAGIALSLYGVRSQKNWGIGDLGDLKDIVDWVSEKLHGNIIGLNPLHATHNRRPFNVSPYLPISKFYRNYIYLDISSLEDYRECDAAQRMVESPETQELLFRLRDSKKVEYEEVGELKMKALRHVFESFLGRHWVTTGRKTSRGVELGRYIEREGVLLENFATFCALDSVMHAKDPTVWTWPQWPREFRRPDTEAVQEFRSKHWEEILFFKYLQWQLEKQLSEVQGYAKSRGMCIGLYHDLALAIDRFGADFWAYQDCFFSELRVGAPPDAFSQNGQDWGFPPARMNKLKSRGYDLFIEEIRKNCVSGGALRIDHAMRFFHLYCIPSDQSPEHGAYVSQPYEDLVGILMLESIRNQVVIIGEDLGTVPEYIRERLGKAGIFSYKLLYFEKNEHDDFLRPQDYPDLALVTISTHDLPTFVGYWTDKDMGIRTTAGLFNDREALVKSTIERKADKEKLLKLSNELGLIEIDFGKESELFSDVTGELHNAVVGLLAQTPCKLFVLAQEDLLKDVNQQNFPGTTHEYPNWSLKMKYSVEELFTLEETKGFSKMFRNWVHSSGRTNLRQKGREYDEQD